MMLTEEQYLESKKSTDADSYFLYYMYCLSKIFKKNIIERCSYFNYEFSPGYFEKNYFLKILTVEIYRKNFPLINRILFQETFPNPSMELDKLYNVNNYFLVRRKEVELHKFPATESFLIGSLVDQYLNPQIESDLRKLTTYSRKYHLPLQMAFSRKFMHLNAEILPDKPPVPKLRSYSVYTKFYESDFFKHFLMVEAQSLLAES